MNISDLTSQEMFDIAKGLRERGLIAIMSWNTEASLPIKVDTKGIFNFLAACVENVAERKNIQENIENVQDLP